MGGNLYSKSKRKKAEKLIYNMPNKQFRPGKDRKFQMYLSMYTFNKWVDE